MSMRGKEVSSPGKPDKGTSDYEDRQEDGMLYPEVGLSPTSLRRCVAHGQCR